MKNIKKIFAASVIAGSLLLGTTTSNAGIIVAGFGEGKNDNPCTTTTTNEKGILVQDFKDGKGIIVAGIVGIIVAGLTGIIVAGATEAPTECGIIVAG